MFHTQLQDSVYRRRIFLFMGSRDDLVHHLTTTWGKKAAQGIYKDAVGMAFYVTAPSVEYPDVQTRVHYLWTRKFDGSVQDIGTLAHESFHIATTILEDLGVDTGDKEGSESIAYYMESIFTQSLTALKGG